MKTIVLKVVNEGTFYELGVVLLFLLLAPLFFFYKASEELSGKYKDVPRGLVYLLGLSVLVVFDLWLAVYCWRELGARLIASFGPWIFGLFIITVLCVIAFPVCALGSQFRLAWDCHRELAPLHLRRRALYVSAGGIFALVLIVVVVATFSSGKFAAWLSAGIFIALIVGWLGHILVPDLDS